MLKRYIYLAWDVSPVGTPRGGADDVRGSFPSWQVARAAANRETNTWSRRTIFDCDTRQLIARRNGEEFPEAQPPVPSGYEHEGLA